MILLGFLPGLSNALPPEAFKSFASALIRYESARPQDKHKTAWKQLADQFPEIIRGLPPGAVGGAIQRAFEPEPGEVRTALVIDNGDYSPVPLLHPAPDADLLAQGLKRLGFTLHRETNANRQQLETAISEFAKASANAQLAFFYFAGKAVQSGSKNFLVPIGAQVAREEEILTACVPVEGIWSAFKKAGIRSAVVLLDGAYDAAFSSGFRPAAPGLAMTSPPSGGMFGISSAPNALIPAAAAAPPPGGATPSLFVFNLIPRLFLPDVPLPEAFSMVKEATRNGTAGGIDPAFKASLGEPVVFNSCVRQFRSLLADLKKLDLLFTLDPPPAVSEAAWGAVQKKHPRRVPPSPTRDIRAVLAQALETPCFESRTALVVGNRAYPQAPLVSAGKEAAVVSETLKKLGFSVTLLIDADSDTLKKNIESFINSLRWDGVGLLYYTGRAFQVGGQNFLLPVGDGDTATGAKEKAVALSYLMDRMSGAQNQLNLVILNAAYGDPSGRTDSGDKPGLAAMSPKPNTFLLSSAAPDTVYPPELAEKQVFSGQLIPLMEQENLPLSRLATTLQVNVMAVTGNQMAPWSSDHLAGSYRFENGASSAFFFTSRERNFGKLLQPLSKYQTIEEMLPGDRMTRNVWESILARFPQFGNGGKATADSFLDAVLRNDPGLVGHGVAARLGLRPTRKNDLAMTFVYVPPGPFSMGSPLDEPARGKDESLFQASLSKGYYIQTTEVTQGQWKAVMGTNPATFRECGSSCPVEEVSWEDAQKFIAALNRRPGGFVYRLPTEAEWEMACRSRGKGSTWFHFGDNEFQLGEYAWVKDNSGAMSHAVAGKKPNERGLFDMHGNVWELCQDWDWTYPAVPTVDPAGKAKATYRVVRGGSWFYPGMETRCANRFYVLPGSGNYNVGLRLVMNP